MHKSSHYAHTHPFTQTRTHALPPFISTIFICFLSGNQLSWLSYLICYKPWFRNYQRFGRCTSIDTLLVCTLFYFAFTVTSQLQAHPFTFSSAPTTAHTHTHTQAGSAQFACSSQHLWIKIFKLFKLFKIFFKYFWFFFKFFFKYFLFFLIFCFNKFFF